MKSLLVLALSLCATAAMADDATGHMSLTLWSQYGGGAYSTDIRVEDGKILGNTFLGPVSIVNLEIKENGVKGWAGGSGNTDLTCAKVDSQKTECSGRVAGTSADFTIVEEELNNGKNLKIKGSMNHRSFELTRNVYGTIKAYGSGGIELKLKEPGHYSGSGSLNGNPYTSFSAEMETDGDLLELCPLGLVIFVAAPITLL